MDKRIDVKGVDSGARTWSRGRSVVCAAALAVPFVIAGAPTEAAACGGEIYMEMDSNTQIVAKAEQLLSKGHYQQAVVKALQAYPALKIIKPGTLHLSDRGLRIIALASARADGTILGGNFKSATATEREANLEWSITTLRTLSSPSYQTDLGEALSRVPAHHAEADKILEDLAAKDLLTSAEGYASLARLRAEGGNAAGREEAVKRCQAMTKDATICAAPEASPAPAPPAAPTPAPPSQT